MELESLKVANGLLGEEGGEGEIVCLSTTTLIERPSVNPLLPVIYKTWNFSPFLYSLLMFTRNNYRDGRIRKHSELDDAGKIHMYNSPSCSESETVEDLTSPLSRDIAGYMRARDYHF